MNFKNIVELKEHFIEQELDESTYILYAIKNKSYYNFSYCIASDFYNKSINSDSQFNELLQAEKASKIYFDIEYDLPSNDTELLSNEITYFFQYCLEILQENYFTIERDEIIKKECILSDASRENESVFKFSKHAILSPDIMLENIYQVKQFVLYCVKTYNHKNIPARDFIDCGVYEHNREMRVLFSHKHDNTGKIKNSELLCDPEMTTIVEDLENEEFFNKMLIEESDNDTCHIRTEEPLLIYQEITSVITGSCIKSVYDKIILLIENELEYFKVREILNNVILFDRISPSFCDICSKTHTNENSLFVAIFDNTVYKKCRRNLNQSKILFKIKNTIETDVEGSLSLFDSFKENNEVDSVDETENNFEDLREINVFEENFDKNVFFIKAEMKMGKTTALLDFIKKKEFKRVVCISFRKTFTNEIIRKSAEKDIIFADYQQSTGVIKDDYIVIEYESLHRLFSVDNFDLIILDEIESVYNEIASNNCEEKHALFQTLIEKSGSVVCMDANLQKQTKIDILNIRKDVIGDDIINYVNTFKPNSEYKYNIVQENYWYKLLFDNIKAGKKIVIPSTTRECAVNIYEYIISNFPDLSVYICTKYDPYCFEKMCNSDVCIYTPTITAGISIENHNYDIMFCYFSNESCDALICSQMMGRVRNLNDKVYYITTNSNELKEKYVKSEYSHSQREIHIIKEINPELISNSNVPDNLLNKEIQSICDEVLEIQNESKCNFVEHLVSIFSQETSAENIEYNDIEYSDSLKKIVKTYNTETQEFLEEKTCTEFEFEELKSNSDNLSADNQRLYDYQVSIRLFDFEGYKLNEYSQKMINCAKSSTVENNYKKLRYLIELHQKYLRMIKYEPIGKNALLYQEMESVPDNIEVEVDKLVIGDLEDKFNEYKHSRVLDCIKFMESIKNKLEMKSLIDYEFTPADSVNYYHEFGIICKKEELMSVRDDAVNSIKKNE